MQDMLPGVLSTVLILLGSTVTNSSSLPIECRMTVNSSVLQSSSGLSMLRQAWIGTSRTKNNQAFTIKKGMVMPVQMSQAQDGERQQVDDQRLDLADDLKEAQDHIQSQAT
ncbi:hypothetical protein Tco_0813125 [Tanacetum coccineum]